jgi:hypothetical protein
MAAAPPEQPTDAKPQEGGPPPPPDMEELVEDIEYEARVDRDVSGVVDVVRDALEDHGKTILDVAGACADKADDDVTALQDEDGCVDPEAVASKCRKVRLQLGYDLEKAWRKAVNDSCDSTRELVDNALEAHATKTHRRLRWLKGRFLESLTTQRGASKANERNLRTQYQGEQKQALIKQRELHRAAIAEVLDRIKAQERESKSRYDALERRCALAEGRLERSGIECENLKSELSLYKIEDDESDIDPIDRIFINGEMNLRSTGVERLQAFERGDLCTQGESTGVGLSPENFRKIKAELRRLKGTIKMLEISLKDTQQTLQKRDWMITDQKNSLVKEKQRCDKLLDRKQKNEREIRNLLKRIDATNKALEKEKSVRKKLQTELEKRPQPEPERSSRSSRPSQMERRRASRESTAELSLPASPPPSREPLRRAESAARMSEPPSPSRSMQQRPDSHQQRPASRARTPAAESEGSPYFPDADHDPLLRVSRPPSYDDYVDDEPRVIIQRDVRVEEALKKQAKEYKAKCRRERDEAVAIITARADGETRRAKLAHEKCVGLERDVSRSLERIARLELVVSEKTALVGELTRLAREQRARAEAAEKQQKLHVTSIGDDISRYQTGPTKRTTPLLEPVTGRVGHVGAPLRQPPPNADTIPGPPLKQRLRAQLRFQVNRRRIIEEAKLMAGAE